eukprot:gnl/MRDRNA2_/MRDRNA2_28746_c0_seq1.p1 gnl/MRDRNA2_/MRDRNA2_28746_c0~~gnl/MRDRNA2_/MRDRNA2_28746_c0_seq1.p1  ORF type:complete len:332 (-),score=54.72 gnl/MRDRNA2_/MRDRNA2_28746_c0_seq1:144-1139(-)
MSASAADLQQLKDVVEKLTERVDYISGVVPQCQYLQDYHHKMESEANMHLRRCKTEKPENAKDESNTVTATLEMQRWLTMVTDNVLELRHSWALLVKSRDDLIRDRSNEVKDCLAPHSKSAAERGPESLIEGQCRPVAQSPIPRAGSGYPSISDPGAERERSRDFLLKPTEGSSPPSYDGFTSVPSSRYTSGTRFDELGRSRNSSGFTQDTATEPLAEPGIGVAEHVDGIMLGRGSWATAYRQASGQRRDALRLLCLSGIVTARELADDNTVISEEHIDECVSIGIEMIHTRPMEQWTRNPNEAKQVFEARLTSMYQRKFGEQHEKEAATG